MVDQARIDMLRRRVREDPASVAFAALAEEYRRGGLLTEAVETCRVGLVHQPAYLSARVTLARALAALGELEAATSEFETAVAAAPEHLAAQRDLGELYVRRGDLPAALAHYRVASALAPQDSELRETVTDLERRLGDQLPDPDAGQVVPLEAVARRPALQLVSDDDLPNEWRFVDQPAAARQIRALEQFLVQIQGARSPRPVEAAGR